MQKGAAYRRLVSWIACFAILMNVLAPAISQTLASGAPSTWDVCSVSNIQSKDKPAPGLHAKCGYCLTNAASFGLPPVDAAALALPDAGSVRPFLFYHAPAPLLALSAAPPRGPPSIA